MLDSQKVDDLGIVTDLLREYYSKRMLQAKYAPNTREVHEPHQADLN